MCSVFSNALFCPVFVFLRVFFLLASTRSAGLQMQSIALVLSQTDFCAALGHLGQPSLASPGPTCNRFKSAILCHLKEKELQSPGFCFLLFAKPLTLMSFCQKKGKSRFYRVGLSELPVFTVLTTKSSHHWGHVVVFYWF